MFLKIKLTLEVLLEAKITPMLKYLLSAAFLGLVLFSCEKEAIAPSVPQVEQTVDGTTELVVTVLYIEHTGTSGGCETYMEYPLVNANVSLYAADDAYGQIVSSLTTDRNGRVYFDGFAKGAEYLISTVYTDGEVVDRTVEVREGQRTYVQLTH